MGIDPGFRKTLSSFLNTVEKPLRLAQMPAEAVDAVFRFGAVVGSRVESHATLPSAFSRLKEMIRQQEQRGGSLASGTVVAARQLTAARGRFARKWHAPQGGLWLAMALAHTLTPRYARLLSLAIGCACCECVRHFDLDARIRWINDILVGGRKIGGVLVESFQSGAGETYLLVGIGLNVNNNLFPPEIAPFSTSMAHELRKTVALDTVRTVLLAKCVWNVGLLFHDEARFLEGGPGGNLIAGYKHLCDSVGRDALFGIDVEQGPHAACRVIGIGDDGAVCLAMADGTTLRESSGEIRYLDGNQSRNEAPLSPPLPDLAKLS